MATTASPVFDSGAQVEAIKPGGPHFWRAARVVDSVDNLYTVCFSGDKTRYQIESKCIRLRPSKKASTDVPTVSTVTFEMSTKVLHPNSAAIAVSSKKPGIDDSSLRFECGALIEAIKPGGPHFWRAARVVGCLEGHYQVTFCGDKKLYNVALKFVRKRPVKEKPKTNVEPTAVVDLTLWSSDSSPEPDVDDDLNTLGHHSLLDPYRVFDPYSDFPSDPFNIHSNHASQPSFDPYAYSQFPNTRESFLNQRPPIPQPHIENMHLVNRRHPPPPPPSHALWRNPQVIKPRKRNSYSWTPIANKTRWQENGKNFFLRDLWPLSDADTRIQPSSSEEAVRREPIAVEKIAREQEKLGLDAALARVSIPRKPLPRNARRIHPRMSLGNSTSTKNYFANDRSDEVSPNSIAVKSVHELPIAPPRLPSKSKVPLRRPRPRQRLYFNDSVSSSDDEGDIRSGPRLSARQRELARKRRAEKANDEAVPRKKQQVIGSRFPRRKQISSVPPHGKSGVAACVRKSKVSKKVPEVVNARGNGRRKGPARRNAGLSSVEVLTNVDRSVDEDFVRHRREVAKSVAELEELSKAMSEMTMNDQNEGSMACDCDIWRGRLSTMADQVLKCYVCGRKTHLMCCGLKRKRILAVAGREKQQQEQASTLALALPSRSPFMCVSCVDLFVRDNNLLVNRVESKEEKRWTVVVPVPPLLRSRAMDKWSAIAALRENKRTGEKGFVKRKKWEESDANEKRQLTDVNKNRMMRNVEDFRSGIVRNSFFSGGAVSRLTVFN